MLVLSRKTRESIRIGDDIIIIVKKIVGNKVVLGVEAPPKERILRNELYEKGADPTLEENKN